MSVNVITPVCCSNRSNSVPRSALKLARFPWNLTLKDSGKLMISKSVLTCFSTCSVSKLDTAASMSTNPFEVMSSMCTAPRLDLQVSLN
jgi:hypothetical protein